MNTEDAQPGGECLVLLLVAIGVIMGFIYVAQRHPNSMVYVMLGIAIALVVPSRRTH